MVRFRDKEYSFQICRHYAGDSYLTWRSIWLHTFSITTTSLFQHLTFHHLTLHSLAVMSTFAKRLGFGKKQNNVINAEVVSPESTSGSDIQVTSDVKDEKGLNLAEDQGRVVKASGTDGRIIEVEANRTLIQIKKKHRWDPNLPEELEEEIEENTDGHDLAGELRLVDELVENSPYPEVRAAVRNVSLPILRPCHMLRVV